MPIAQPLPHDAPTASGLVLDTNVALDWMVFDDPHAQPLARAICAGQVRWLSCPGMQAELQRMLRHASLAHRAPDAARAQALLEAHACLLADPAPQEQPPRPTCSDADDQIFIDLALQHRARWLVTRDKALLKLARRLRMRGLAVVRPQDWSHDG